MKNFKLVFFSEKDRKDLLKGCLYVDIDFSDCVVDVCTSRDSSGGCVIDTCNIDDNEGHCTTDICGTDFNSGCENIDSCGRDGDNHADCPNDVDQPCTNDFCLAQDGPDYCNRYE